MIENRSQNKLVTVLRPIILSPVYAFLPSFQRIYFTVDKTFNMPSPTSVKVQILNAFVDNNAGGNPAGVVLHADDLTNEQKQAVAAKAGLSEVAFVSQSSVADYKLDFFTPTRQIAHCGHATIATFSYLAQMGFIKNNPTSKETIDGRREIILKNDLAFMEQKAPRYLAVPNEETAILDALHISRNELLEAAPILIVHTGNSFAIIGVQNLEILKNIQPDLEAISRISDAFDLVGFYVFCPQTNIAGRDAATRMFAPRYGIAEESATGMAAGPLACYLYNQMGLQKSTVLIEQGWYMQPASPSLLRIELTIENEKITKLMAGGKGKLQSLITIEI